MKYVGTKDATTELATQADIGTVYVDPNEMAGTPVGHMWYDSDDDTEDLYNWNALEAWNAGRNYFAASPVSVVTYQGETYAAIANSLNVIPGTNPAVWTKIAAKGVDGANGANGKDSTAVVNNDPPPASSFPNSIIPEGSIWIEPDAGNLTKQESFVRNAQRVMGTSYLRKIVSSLGPSWTGSPITIYGAGRGPTIAKDGYLHIAMPANGTVITKLGAPGGTTTVTVTGGYIPMLAGETLWWVPPLGSAYNAVGTFYLTAAGSSGVGLNYDVPETWIRVITRAGGYPSDPSAYIWGDGQAQSYWIAPTLLNGWVNYGPASFSPAAWKKVNGYVTWRGLIGNGTGQICALDATNGNYNYGTSEIFVSLSANAIGRIDVSTVSMSLTLGTNSFVSLANIAYWNVQDS